MAISTPEWIELESISVLERLKVLEEEFGVSATAVAAAAPACVRSGPRLRVGRSRGPLAKRASSL